MNSRDEENKLRKIKEDVTGKPFPDPIAVAIENLDATIKLNSYSFNNSLISIQYAINDLTTVMKRIYKLDENQ